MIGFALVCGLLSVPAGHQVVSHRILSHGHEPTAHELAHRARSRRMQWAADALWCVYLAGAALAGLALR